MTIEKNKIEEIKCNCNQCKKVWHYLKEEEKKINAQIGWSACGQMTCCLPLQLYSKNEGGKWEQQKDKFKKCPECGSLDITKKSIYHDKKE